MAKTSILAAVTLACLAAGAGSAAASPVTINFTGTINNVDAALAGQFSAGQSLSGSYTFESTTGARIGSTSQFAVFDALTAVNLLAGTYAASSPSGAPRAEIQVDNDPGGGFFDRYGLVARSSDGLTGASVNGNNLSAFIFRMDDATNSVFSDALVLPNPIDLGSFSSSAFFLFFDGPSVGFDERAVSVVSGTLTSVSAVPEPGSLLLLGSGIAAGLARRRRERAGR